MGGWPPGHDGGTRLFLVLGLGLLILLAGCSTSPFGGLSEQEQPATLIVNNSANTTQTFEVWVVELPASLTISYRDGSVVEARIGQGLSGTDAGPRTITNISFPDSARRYGRFTLDPGEANQRSMENFSHNSALVVVASKDDGGYSRG